GGANQRAGAIERMHIHGLPEMLDLHGIVADQEVAKVFDTRHGRATFALKRGLAPAYQSRLVGLDLDKDIRPVRVRRKRNTKDFEVGDLDAGAEVAKRITSADLPVGIEGIGRVS